MERYLEKLVAVESLLIAVEISESDEVVLVDAEAVLDLTEFDLTPQEAEKFNKIFKKMNVSLAESFQKRFPASSVISEIRSQR